MKATVCRIFGLRRRTLIDSLARIGWSAGLNLRGDTADAPTATDRTQIAALFDPPIDRRELVRHCTLSEADTAMIRRCRGDHSRLGYALMLCYLRYPGRPLRINERPPAALISFVAEQIDIRPESIDDYLISGQNRRRHAAELQDRLRLRPFGRRPASELASSLLPHAIESDRLAVLAGLVVQECWQRRIVVPSLRSLERLCVDLRHQARRDIERRLTGGLLAEQRRQLDALTESRAESGQSWLVWLRNGARLSRNSRNFFLSVNYLTLLDRFLNDAA
jgi:hypothetical protein